MHLLKRATSDLGLRICAGLVGGYKGDAYADRYIRGIGSVGKGEEGAGLVGRSADEVNREVEVCLAECFGVKAEPAGQSKNGSAGIKVSCHVVDGDGDK